MGKKRNDRLPWLEGALQGLVFWMGYRRSLFHDYPLTEAALVSEFCHLIQTNKPEELKLLPERMYRDLVPSGTEIENITPKARADLVLYDSGTKKNGRNGNMSDSVRFVIEAKRGVADKKDIKKDLLRLHSFLKTQHSGVRAFFVVLSERAIPNGRFVKDGKAWPGVHRIEGSDGGFYKVRRTVKASLSFTRKKNAHYACLAEVGLRGQKLKDF